MKKGMVLCVLMALVSAPALAVSVTEINIGNFGSEPSLFEIVNAVYGTVANGNAEGNGLFGTNFVNNADLLSIEHSPDEIFTLLGSESLSASFRARFAAQSQEFGFYEPADGGPVTAAERTDLLTINGFDGTILTDIQLALAIIGGADVSAGATVGPGTLGFYDNTPNDDGQIFYSESVLNPLGLDHMVSLMLDQTFDAGSGLFTTTFLLAFEDISTAGGDGLPGDGDYNDLVVEVTFIGTTPFDPPIPEPASVVLLGMGMAGMALRKRFFA